MTITPRRNPYSLEVSCISMHVVHIPSCNQWAIHVLKHQKLSLRHQDAWASSFCVATMIQQWEMTDWWNNEQQHAGWMRVLAHAFICSSNVCMQATPGAVHLPPSSAPAVPGMVDAHAEKLFERVRQNKQIWKLLPLLRPQVTLPPLCDLGAFFVLSHFSLLINPSPSRCGFDAADGRAVLILSPKKL